MTRPRGSTRLVSVKGAMPGMSESRLVEATGGTDGGRARAGSAVRPARHTVKRRMFIGVGFILLSWFWVWLRRWRPGGRISLNQTPHFVKGYKVSGLEKTQGGWKQPVSWSTKTTSRFSGSPTADKVAHNTEGNYYCNVQETNQHRCTQNKEPRDVGHDNRLLIRLSARRTRFFNEIKA